MEVKFLKHHTGSKRFDDLHRDRGCLFSCYDSCQMCPDHRNLEGLLGQMCPPEGLNQASPRCTKIHSLSLW